MESIGSILRKTGAYPQSTKTLKSFSPVSDEIDSHVIERAQKWRENYGYAPNPFCRFCAGGGMLYPRINGKLDYSQIIYCKAPGCLDESWRRAQAGEKALAAKGLSSYRFTLDGFIQRLGTETVFSAFFDLAEGKNCKPFLLCIGGTGCGKSHLCEALTLRLNQRGIDTWYYPVASLMGKLKSAIQDNSTESCLASLSGLPGLVLDDWWASTATDYEVNLLERIIDARYRERRITVLTSNQSLVALKTAEPRIISRFSDSELSVVVVNSANDYRSHRTQI